MGYHVIDPAEVDPMEGRSAEAVPVGEEAGLTRRDDKLGLRLYVADPGEQLPMQYHYHDEQVEAFYVLEGCLHVETPAGEHVVETDQVFVVEPGSPHRAFNPPDADGAARVLAIGAPSLQDAHAYDPDEQDPHADDPDEQDHES